MTNISSDEIEWCIDIIGNEEYSTEQVVSNDLVQNNTNDLFITEEGLLTKIISWPFLITYPVFVS